MAELTKKWRVSCVILFSLMKNCEVFHKSIDS